MDKGQYGFPGLEWPPPSFSSLPCGKQTRVVSLAGNPSSLRKTPSDRPGAEKAAVARPQDEGLLAGAEDENAGSAGFPPRPVC